MKKLFLSAVMLTGIVLAAKAQDEDVEKKKPLPPTQTELNFNMPSQSVSIRDYIFLPNKARMIIELVNAEQYKELSNLDSLLTQFVKEIFFYKDSLENGSGSVRIDYAIDEAYSFNKIRFKKHPSDGDIFMSKPTDKAKLKLDQDTIRIYYRHSPLNDANQKIKHRSDYPIYNSRYYQITFCLNNYTDIAAIAADKATLQHALDTLYATKKKKTKQHPYANPSSARYNPYAPDNTGIKKRWLSYADVRFKQYDGLVKSDNAKNWDVLHRADVFTSTANLGMGLVRNTFAPYAEIGFSLIMRGRRLNTNNEYHEHIIGLSNSSYFFFEKNTTGDYDILQNNFLNVSYGEGRDLSVGAGYLYWKTGNYFNGLTAKLFFNVTLLKKGLTLSPEVIFTNDFNQIFPGLTLKVF